MMQKQESTSDFDYNNNEEGEVAMIDNQAFVVDPNFKFRKDPL